MWRDVGVLLLGLGLTFLVVSFLTFGLYPFVGSAVTAIFGLFFWGGVASFMIGGWCHAYCSWKLRDVAPLEVPAPSASLPRSPP